jgi:hypothetical protein
MDFRESVVEGDLWLFSNTFDENFWDTTLANWGTKGWPKRLSFLLLAQFGFAIGAPVC